MTRKEKNHKFIKNFSKITISGICKKLNVERTNIILGTTSEENLEKVKEEIQKEIAKLYMED